jgi:hypothetical protein
MKINKTAVITTKVVLELENEEVQLMSKILSVAYSVYDFGSEEYRFADELTYDRNLGYSSRSDQLGNLSLGNLKALVGDVENANKTQS